MIYTLSVDSFKNTFAVKADGSKLTHHSGIKFKLFPFIANNNSDPVMDLSSIVGRYLGQIEGKEPVAISAEELIVKLRNDEELEIKLGADKFFDQVVRHMFFDKDGKIRPINLRMLSQIPCTESNERKLADYLVDVLGDSDTLKESIDEASKKVDILRFKNLSTVLLAKIIGLQKKSKHSLIATGKRLPIALKCQNFLDANLQMEKLLQKSNFCLIAYGYSLKIRLETGLILLMPKNLRPIAANI